MSEKRSLMSLIGFCVLAVMGAALALATIVAGGVAALASQENADEPQQTPSIAQSEPLAPHAPAQTTFTGMITDSRCGARHFQGSENSAQCARTCVREGAKYILVDGDRHYWLTGGHQLLDGLAGQRANVSGALRGNTIRVTAAAALP